MGTKKLFFDTQILHERLNLTFEKYEVQRVTPRPPRIVGTSNKLNMHFVAVVVKMTRPTAVGSTVPSRPEYCLLHIALHAYQRSTFLEIAAYVNNDFYKLLLWFGFTLLFLELLSEKASLLVTDCVNVKWPSQTQWLQVPCKILQGR